MRNEENTRDRQGGINFKRQLRRKKNKEESYRDEYQESKGRGCFQERIIVNSIKSMEMRVS